MEKNDGVRSGYAKVGNLVYFARMLDKVRLSDEGRLPPGYNLGDQNPLFFDGVCCRLPRLNMRRLSGTYGQVVPTKRSWNGLIKPGNTQLRMRSDSGTRL
jgi:hypothetical protein